VVEVGPESKFRSGGGGGDVVGSQGQPRPQKTIPQLPCFGLWNITSLSLYISPLALAPNARTQGTRLLHAKMCVYGNNSKEQLGIGEILRGCEAPAKVEIEARELGGV
jgi:hypothetical protein